MMISFALVAINGQLPTERHRADDTGLHKSEWAGYSKRPRPHEQLTLKSPSALASEKLQGERQAFRSNLSVHQTGIRTNCKHGEEM